MDHFPGDPQAFLDPGLLTGGSKLQPARGRPLLSQTQNQHAQGLKDGVRQPSYSRVTVSNSDRGSTKRQRSNTNQNDELFDLLLTAPPDECKKVISGLLSRFGPDDITKMLEYLRAAVRLSSPSFSKHDTNSFDTSSNITSSNSSLLHPTDVPKVSHDQQVLLEPTIFDAIPNYPKPTGPHSILAGVSTTDISSRTSFGVSTNSYPPIGSTRSTAMSKSDQVNLSSTFNYSASNAAWDPKHESIFSTSSYNSTGSVFSATSNRSSSLTVASQPSFFTPSLSKTMSTTYTSVPVNKTATGPSRASRSSSYTRKSNSGKYICSQEGCLTTFTRDDVRVRHEQHFHNPNGKITCLLDTCNSTCPPNCQNDFHMSPFPPNRPDKITAHLKAHGPEASLIKILPCWRGQYRHHQLGWSCNTCGEELGSWFDNEELIKQHFESHKMDGNEMQIDDTTRVETEQISEEMEVLEERLSQTSIEKPEHSILEYRDVPATKRLPPSAEDYEFYASFIQSQMGGG